MAARNAEGVCPQCAQVRGTLLTASQCATYDDTKRLWMQATGWRDGLGTHIGTSMITGAILTLSFAWRLHAAGLCPICLMPCLLHQRPPH